MIRISANIATPGREAETDFICHPVGIERCGTRAGFAQVYLTVADICRSICDAAPVGVAEPLAPHFAGTGVRSCDRTASSGCGQMSVGPLLERSMMPPAKPVTLLNGKVSTQVG